MHAETLAAGLRSFIPSVNIRQTVKKVNTRQQDTFIMSILRAWLSRAPTNCWKLSSHPRSIVMGADSRFTRRAFAALRVPPFPITCNSPAILPPDIPIEEELNPDYNPKHFLPVNPGDCLDNRYETIAKLGWGSCSTVWLAQDRHRYASQCKPGGPIISRSDDL